MFSYFKLCIKSSPTIRYAATRKNSTIYDRYKQSILFSSFIEDNKLHLSHRKKYILKKAEKKQNRLIENANIRIKPFSVALNYLVDERKKIQASDVVVNLPDINVHKVQYNPTDSTDWMDDYESFNDMNDNVKSKFGTADPTVPVSKVSCFGCGANLHCADSSLPGYLPSELFCGQGDDYLKTITCQRCHFLKNYNTAIDVTVGPDEYVRMISSIADKFALAILMVDLTDFPCSIWPGIRDILGTKRPVFVVGNKVDLLPQDSKGYLSHIKECLETAIADSGISRTNIKHTCLISAQTGFGVEELITRLHNVWAYKGDVYLIGCTNVGKSSLFNALLRSDYCKVKASNIIQKATASSWPGTTLRMLKFPILRPSDWRLYVRTKRITSERSRRQAEEQLRRDQASATGQSKYATLIGHIGQTFNEKTDEDKTDFFGMGKGDNSVLSINEQSKDYVHSKWCFDTPGVEQPDQVFNLLTTEELLLVIPKQMITPRVFLMKPGMSLFLAGLGRVDYLQHIDNDVESIRMTVFASSSLPILIVKTDDADRIYKELLGTDYLAVPTGDLERLKRWPFLRNLDVINITGKGPEVSACDILLSSSGWVGVNCDENKEAHFRAWTPEARGIFVRDPSLIPYGVRLRGPRIRGSLAYISNKSFMK